MNTSLVLLLVFFDLTYYAGFLFMAKIYLLSPSGCLRTVLIVFNRVFYWRSEQDLGRLYPFHIITERVSFSDRSYTAVIETGR
jgi:hypothetical protein